MDPPDSASRVFCSRILSMVNADDVSAIILAQKNMLDRFEKTNEMLLNFNNLSSARLQQMNERFLHHTRTLVEMKRDLDSIFRRIRTLKGKLARQHPEAFSHIPEASLLEDEDEDPIPPSTTTTIATSEPPQDSQTPSRPSPPSPPLRLLILVFLPLPPMKVLNPFSNHYLKEVSETVVEGSRQRLVIHSAPSLVGPCFSDQRCRPLGPNKPLLGPLWSKPSNLGEQSGIFLYPMFTDAVGKLSIKRLLLKRGGCI
uniref:KxDL motif-containing protein 1 n=1 Tax=Capra hircus TaxID=9925 RepID=A0A8C2NWI1_CAPHI